MHRSFHKMIFIIAVVLSLLPSLVQSQTLPAQSDTVPRITETMVRAEMDIIAQDDTLDVDAKEPILTIYKSALNRIGDGNLDKDTANRYKNSRENAPADIETENVNLKDVQALLNNTNRDLFREYSTLNLGLAELEQRLAEENANLNFLRGLNATHQTARVDADKFSSEYPDLRAENDARIAELKTQLGQESDTTPSALNNAALILAQANLYARLQSNTVLNERNNGIALENSLLAAKISHTAAQISLKSDSVNTLQIMTGSARTSVAEQRQSEAELALQSVEPMHALLQFYAQENVDLSKRLLDIAKTEEDVPASKAKIARQKTQVKFDQNIADQIIGTKKTSRNYGAHLRQLRQKQPRIAQMKSDIKARSLRLQDVLFQKIINQEALDLFNATPLDIGNEIEKYVALHDDGSALTVEDTVKLRALHNTRRDILNALASYSEIKRKNLSDVNISQSNVLEDVVTLCALLDSRLLWLPSTEPVSFSWPGRVFAGMKGTLNGPYLSQIGIGFFTGVSKNFFLIFMGILFAGLVQMFRLRMKPILSGMSAQVGRVQKDGYILTPTAVLHGILRALPLAIIPLVFGLVFSNASVDLSLALPFMRTCIVVSGLVIVLWTLREWCKKGALFDLHFRVDKELRTRLIQHLPWLLSTQIISVGLIGLTRDNLGYDSGISALGVLGFLIGSVSIAVFTIKIAWARNNGFKNSMRDADGIYLRNEKWFFLIAIIVPSVTALLAVFGYFETARLLLSRFFMSFCILVGAYVVHGLFRRSVVIAQRRLALEQARRRRDQAVSARREKVAAEERGEIPVPTLDYEQIDLETINRQSSQLVNVAVFIFTVGVLWALWSSLLPALSVFNDVQAWGYDKLDSSGHNILDKETGKPIHVAISYWNLMQAFGIGLITWLAARNLPGFLEIFVLKRMQMQQSSRFAIVTVLGYIIFIFGILIAFDKLGTQWSQLQWIVAALSVGIGLGLQAIFANFVSGLIILFERPVRIGDYITVGDISGTVTRIQIRATTLMDLDNKEILIPNQELVSQQVVNWTLGNSVTRLKVKVGIAYGSDTKIAHKVMLDTVKANPNVLGNPEPTALFLGFGDSTLDFEIRVFLRDFVQRFVVSHELHMALDEALRDAGIEIAFPQRDLNIKNVDAILPSSAPTTTKPAKPKVRKAKVVRKKKTS